MLGIGFMGWDHWRLAQALNNGEAQVVDGPIQSWGTERVRNVRRDKYDCNPYERFHAGDSIWFGYYRNVWRARFHSAQDPLIEFKDGMRVRATYFLPMGRRPTTHRETGTHGVTDRTVQ